MAISFPGFCILSKVYHSLEFRSPDCLVTSPFCGAPNKIIMRLSGSFSLLMWKHHSPETSTLLGLSSNVDGYFVDKLHSSKKKYLTFIILYFLILDILVVAFNTFKIMLAVRK